MEEKVYDTRYGRDEEWDKTMKEYYLDGASFDWKMYGLLVFFLGGIEKLTWFRKCLLMIVLGKSIYGSYNMLQDYCLRLGIPIEYAIEYWVDYPHHKKSKGTYKRVKEDGLKTRAIPNKWTK